MPLVVLGDIIQQGTMQAGLLGDRSVPGACRLRVLDHIHDVRQLEVVDSPKLLEGVPIVLIADGRPIDAAVAVEHMPLDEVIEAARQQGCEDIRKIKLAVLEVSGKISIIQD